MSQSVPLTTKTVISVAALLSSTGQTIMDHHSYTSLKSQRKLTNGSKVSDVLLILAEDPKHVVVVHCNSGKGRTGTAICCILLFCGFYDNLDDCLRFYGHQRFTCGKGVSQPEQLRYLYYFEAFHRGQIKSPSVKTLRAIEFHKIPTAAGSGVYPFFEVYHCHGLDIKLLFTYQPTRWYMSKEGSATFKLCKH
jgi:Tyrosine phosphatase family